MVELSGPEDSQANVRVEREIQTARGLARTLVRQVSERAGIQVKCSGPIFSGLSGTQDGFSLIFEGLVEALRPTKW